jgi:hypothetical protein
MVPSLYKTAKRTNAEGMVFKSLHTDPSIGAFVEKCPKGRGRDAARFT